MTSSTRYAAVATGVVFTAVLLFWPFLDDVGRLGVAIAALVALPIQISSFALMQRYRGVTNRFLAAWLGGTVARMTAIGVVAFFVLGSGTEGAVPTLLALASFFFGLLMLEPVYFSASEQKA